MSTDGRGLDHLMEQNDTELDFLSAYGGVDDGEKGDADALFAAVHRFLLAGGVVCEQQDATLVFEHGKVQVDERGCWLTFTGDHLPLVSSDLHAPGFVNASLAKDRSSVTVQLTEWSLEQRRFIERLVEHHRAA